MIDFMIRYPHKIVEPLLSHLRLTGITLLLSFFIAVLIAVLIMRSRWLSQITVGLLGAVYAIPSLALFAILIPFFGLGEKTAIIVLVTYNQFILVRNILAGFRSIDPAVTESAVGMGMSETQIFFKIKLPLASPVMLAGVKIAVISTIGITTIAATINAGGLGQLLFDGLRTRNTIKILWGSLLSALLAIIANWILTYFENNAKRAISGERRIKDEL